jgi:tRNA pseudouridine38-40 synthase
MTRNFLVKICFDGTCYAGWQIQPNAPTVQAQIQKVLTQIHNEDIKVQGCSRTDTGVHAKEFFFNFHTTKNLPVLMRSMNALLPSDIRVIAIREVPLEFHARFHAKSKIYEYNISTAKVQCPFLRETHLHMPHPLDLDLMQQGAKILEGKHDFRGFSNENQKGSAKTSPIKTLKPITFIKSKDLLTIRFQADGFLYKMVRNLTQTLLHIGTKKMALRDCSTILTSKDRRLCPQPAQAHGLALLTVEYTCNQQVK